MKNLFYTISVLLTIITVFIAISFGIGWLMYYVVF
jgi:hypothetical protein